MKIGKYQQAVCLMLVRGGKTIAEMLNIINLCQNNLNPKSEGNQLSQFNLSNVKGEDGWLMIC